MNVEIRLPELGEDAVAAANVSAWLAPVGTRLREGDDLLEITTDKAAFCVPCPQDGTLVATRVNEGDDIRPGDIIAVLDV